jgi:uncharacterized protein
LAKNKNNKKNKNSANNIKHSISFPISIDSKRSDCFFLTLLVKPNARENRCFQEGENLCLNITDPPTKGKANNAIIKFLGKKLSISKSSIILVRGKTSTTKMFRIFTPNLDFEDILSKIIDK